jgi:hypothetical protein
MALALSTTSQEEARTTAVIALRLIDKHKLLEQPAPQRAPSRGVSWSGPGSVAWEEFMRATAAAAPPQPKPRPWNPAEHKRAEAPPGYKWTTVPRIGRARCLHCGASCTAGEHVMLWSGHGFIHEACWPLAEPTL